MTAELRALIDDIRAEIDREHAKVRGDDGYNYAAGHEYGLRQALIIIDRALTAAEQALSAAPQGDEPVAWTSHNQLHFAKTGFGRIACNKAEWIEPIALYAAPAAVPAWQVKPLEWVDRMSKHPNHVAFHAKTAFCEYRAWTLDGQASWSNDLIPGRYPVDGGVEAAKAAAEADHEQRVRSEILPSAGPAWQTMDAKALAKFHLWFFRDMSSEQRLALFRLFGMPVDEIGETHGHQRIALNDVLRLFPAAPLPSQPAEGGRG